MDGLREGKGCEKTNNGTYEGEWKANNKHGAGIEVSKLGTVYEGRWINNQKSSWGVRKMVFGDQEEQVSVDTKRTFIILIVSCKKHNHCP